MVVLDELLGAIGAQIVTLEQVLDLTRRKPATVHLVLTVRGAPWQIVEEADLVTEMRLIKHPCTPGIVAQKGLVTALGNGWELDAVVGQVVRYMKWVERKPNSRQDAKGIIICRETDQKLYYALKKVRDVSPKYYAVNFKLTDTPATTMAAVKL